MEANPIEDSASQEGFIEPVVRCESCQALVKAETLRKHGACTKCGNRRVRNVAFLNETEVDQVREWGYDEFLSLFEATDE